MQLMIDLLAETPAAIRQTAQFLTEHAAMREAMAIAGQPALGTTSLPKILPPPPPPSADVPAGTSAGGPSASPLAPPPPPAPDAMPTATAPASAPSAPPVATTTPNNASVATTTTGVIADEYDSAGMPWDARIHQSSKARKKDRTWKLRKGIDPAIVTQVTQELHAAGRVRSPGATVPPMPAPAANLSVVASAAPAAPAAQAPEAPPPPVNLQPAPVPVPAAPAMGLPDAGQPSVVQVGFRELVAKFSAARSANRLTADQITSIVQQAGAPSLQMLANMAHLVPKADELLDIALASS